MVVTTAPSHCNASIVHDFIARPFTCTTQAPHWVVSQPTCVPVKPSVSLRKPTSIVRPSTTLWTKRPFTVIKTSGIVLSSSIISRLAESPHRPLKGSVGLFFDRRTLSRPFDGAPDPHWGHRHRNFSHAERRECVQNGVHDRRCRADGGALANAPNTERVQIGWDLRVASLKGGEVGGVRHCVVVESANQRLAAASVKHRFHESLTDTLCRPAMHLTVDEQRVDDSAAVVHHDVTQ